MGYSNFYYALLDLKKIMIPTFFFFFDMMIYIEFELVNY
jgi:hypothetical protein